MVASNGTTWVFGNELAAKVDAVVSPDGWNGWTGRLVASDWDRAAFYLTTNSGGPIKMVAVNVKLTGRTLQSRGGQYWVRAAIEFVGDGEPSTFTGGWVLAGWAGRDLAI